MKRPEAIPLCEANVTFYFFFLVGFLWIAKFLVSGSLYREDPFIIFKVYPLVEMINIRNYRDE